MRPFPPPPPCRFFCLALNAPPWFWVGWLDEKRKKLSQVWEKETWNHSIIAMEPGNNKTWSPNQHKLSKAENMMVDVMVKSKKDKPLKLIYLEIMNNTMLIVQINRIDLSKKRFYYLVPTFWQKKKAKNLGGSYDAKRRKKEDGLIK